MGEHLGWNGPILTSPIVTTPEMVRGFDSAFVQCDTLPACSKVAHLMPGAHTGGKVYNQGVRYYTTKPMNGGTTFKCTFCEHTVTTLAFNVTNGNRRTQAAAEINQHAALLHLRPPLPKLTVRSAF
jgi:hypothetical protein